MPFVLQEVQNYGTSHPVVARLQYQSGELLKNCSLSADQSEAVFGYMMDVSRHVLNMWSIKDKISSSVDEMKNSYSAIANGGVYHAPYIIDFDADVERFLYSSKNALRDASRIFNPVYGTDFAEAKLFYLGGSGDTGKILHWVGENLGADSNIYELIANHKSWVKFVCELRNCVEHPEGKKGPIEIRNFLVGNNGALHLPVWGQKNQGTLSIVHSDMDGICNMMLDLVEGIFVGIVSRFPNSDLFEICEIEESSRNSDAPMKFVWAPTEKLQKMLGSFPIK